MLIEQLFVIYRKLKFRGVTFMLTLDCRSNLSQDRPQNPTDGPVALVIGVKRLQIFFMLLMGYLFFKDKTTKHIWVATFIMVLGVLMIRLG